MDGAAVKVVDGLLLIVERNAASLRNRTTVRLFGEGRRIVSVSERISASRAKLDELGCPRAVTTMVVMGEANDTIHALVVFTRCIY